jgi:DNA-binding transcriptional LysR family regulator
VVRLARPQEKALICKVMLQARKTTSPARGIAPGPPLKADPMAWDQVRLFLAVARGGTLLRAAERLALDVSTVSRRLDRLEEELGVLLFQRARHGTALTEAAEQMLPIAEEMEATLHRFAAAVAQVETEVEGVVRLTVPPGVADTFVAPLLPELCARHPRLVVELDASVSYADLTRREADIALRARRPASGDLVVTRVYAGHALPMTSPAYAESLGRLRKLDDARWIAWGEDLAHIGQARWLREHAPGVVPVLRTSHFGSQLAAARAGLGVMMASEPYRAHGLVPVRPSRALAGAWAALPEEELWLVGHPALRNVPRVAAVWSFIVETFGAAAAAAVRRARAR